MSTRDLLQDVAQRSTRYLEGLDTRSVAPSSAALQGLAHLGGPFPDVPMDPADVLALLDEAGSPATMATAGARFFGFVTGGALPAALAANWLAGAWDQNAGPGVCSPVSVTLEEIALGWLVDVLGLPEGCAGSFVTGATMANMVALGAARHRLLARTGWDVEADGLFGAPPITVVVGEEVHISLLKALGLLGLGRNRVVRVPVDHQGRMRVDRLPQLPAHALVCIQAGNVNTGAFDPAKTICEWAHAADAWVHVDGAFGLWAAAAPGRSQLADGINLADSWATDAHKWLNVPYDSGLAFVRDAEALRAAMSPQVAAYIPSGQQRDPLQYTPEMSRRARGVDIWAALRALGRTGLADLIERTCCHAMRFAEGLRTNGYEVLNDVALNQVLAHFIDDETTLRVISGVQAEGTCWCGGTVWQGRAAMRISVSSWATAEEDVDASLAAILRVASREQR